MDDSTPTRSRVLGAESHLESAMCNCCLGRQGSLKRCGACLVTVYCSKECQRADWSSHKHMCKATRIAEGHEGAGFSSPIALAHAMRTWAETHEFAMSYMANAAVVLHGKGVENTLNSPCAVFYPLASNRASGSGDDDDSDNPATTFRLASFPTVISPDTPTGSYLREALEKGLADCKKVANLHRTVLPYHRSYAGVIAAIFMVNGTTHINQFCYPIYRVHQHNDCPLDHVPFVAWKNVMVACRQAVDTGRVLKAPDYSTRFQPHVGTYRRRGKKWIWVCSEEEDQAMASKDTFIVCDLV